MHFLEKISCQIREIGLPSAPPHGVKKKARIAQLVEQLAFN